MALNCKNSFTNVFLIRYPVIGTIGVRQYVFMDVFLVNKKDLKVKRSFRVASFGDISGGGGPIWTVPPNLPKFV